MTSSTQTNTFHHVHVHSDSSILDGSGFPEEYVDLAIKHGMGYVAITDHGMAAAWPSLMDSCMKKGVRPVYGVELYMNDYHYLVPDFSKLSDEMKLMVKRNDHMLVFAENEKGFENLIKLVSKGWLEGYYRNPRVSWKDLSEHSEGLVITTGCLASPLNRRLSKDDPDGAKELLRKWHDVFQDRLYVEWQMIDIDQQDANNPILMNLAEDMGIETIVTNDTHYALESDAKMQAIQLLISSGGGTLQNPKGLQFDSKCHWFKSEDEMDYQWERKYRSVMDNRDDMYERSKLNTLKLCQRCGYVNPDRSPKLPEIPDADDELLRICYDALIKRGLSRNKIYRMRLQEELILISKKRFSSYFLIQREIIMAVRKEFKKDIGPGRGSAGGCLVAWLLGITQLDPVKHGTLFSRFLSPSRGGRQMCLHP